MQEEKVETAPAPETPPERSLDEEIAPHNAGSCDLSSDRVVGCFTGRYARRYHRPPVRDDLFEELLLSLATHGFVTSAGRTVCVELSDEDTAAGVAAAGKLGDVVRQRQDADYFDLDVVLERLPACPFAVRSHLRNAETLEPGETGIVVVSGGHRTLALEHLRLRRGRNLSTKAELLKDTVPADLLRRCEALPFGCIR